MKANVESEISLIEENAFSFTNNSGVIEIVEIPMDIENPVPHNLVYLIFINNQNF